MNKVMISRLNLSHVDPAAAGCAGILPAGRDASSSPSPSVPRSDAEVVPMRTFSVPPPTTLSRLLEAFEQQYAGTAR